MNEFVDEAKLRQGGHHSVQHYLDEQPFWADGTEASGPKMTAMQWRIWLLSVAGKPALACNEGARRRR